MFVILFCQQGVSTLLPALTCCLFVVVWGVFSVKKQQTQRANTLTTTSSNNNKPERTFQIN
jgi:hypothetical protein